MIVPILEQKGFLRAVSFSLCYCGDTLLGVRKPTGLDFQSLDEMSQLWWLSFPFFYNGRFIPRKKKSSYLGTFYYLLPALFW
jgi:hypothetical protein